MSKIYTMPLSPEYAPLSTEKNIFFYLGEKGSKTEETKEGELESSVKEKVINHLGDLIEGGDRKKIMDYLKMLEDINKK